MEARSGSLEPGRPSRARSANTRHAAGLPHTPPDDRMYATDVRQTDVRRQTASSLNVPWARHNKGSKKHMYCTGTEKDASFDEKLWQHVIGATFQRKVVVIAFTAWPRIYLYSVVTTAIRLRCDARSRRTTDCLSNARESWQRCELPAGSWTELPPVQIDLCAIFGLEMVSAETAGSG